jgi:hypothetical protein
MARPVEIARQVVDALSAAPLPFDSCPRLELHPRLRREELDRPVLLVVPRSTTSTRGARDRWEESCEVAVLVHAPLDREDSLQQMEDLVGLAEAVADSIRSMRIDEARLVEIAVEPIPAPEDVEQLRQYTGVVRATFVSHVMEH